MTMTVELAGQFARSTLGHIGREYPNKLDHVMSGAQDVRGPAALHPIFHGSFDWHSCVHGWWQLLRLARLFPAMPEAGPIRDRADEMLTPQRADGELAYFRRPGSTGFERPYGWAWLLALHGEAERHADAPWHRALAPLAEEIAGRFLAFLPRLTYPLRAGTHSNIAFALVHAWDWSGTRNPELRDLIGNSARRWFGDDSDCQAWEPGGDEFLSPALIEALLMSRVLNPADFRDWFARFLPRAQLGEPQTLFQPAYVSDRTDGKIAHLDGLNLSRAWCWRAIAARLGPDHPLHDRAQGAALIHLDAALPHLASDYMGEHWLATFALLALEA